MKSGRKHFLSRAALTSLLTASITAATAITAAEPIVPATPTAWSDNPNSVAYDHFDQTSMWFFHWGLNAGLWQVDLQPPGSNPTLVATNKVGGPNMDGGTVRPGDGYILVTDWEGDGTNIDDSIHLLDRSGNLVAFWETDQGLAGTPCSGPPIHMIQDVAMDHTNPDLLYVTQQGNNTIFSIDISNTSKGTASPSPCTIVEVATAAIGFADVTGIEYDACHDGFWLSDYESPNVALVDNDGSFSTVIHQFSASSGLPWNDGVSPDFSDSERIGVWLTDYSSDNYSVWDSGLGKCTQREGNQYIRVRKFFDDANPAQVVVRLSCNDGLIPDHEKLISEDSGIEWVITEFTPGELDCTVTEVVPAGYAASFAPSGAENVQSCHFEGLTGGVRTCNITNELQAVEVEVTKRWFDEFPRFGNSTFARAHWSCDGVARGPNDGYLWFSGDGAESSFWPLPRWDGTTVCSVTEKIHESSVESDSSGCEALKLLPGQDRACTITNTRIYEGIPTLRDSGLILLALLLLATGVISFRRLL